MRFVLFVGWVRQSAARRAVDSFVAVTRYYFGIGAQVRAEAPETLCLAGYRGKKLKAKMIGLKWNQIFVVVVCRLTENAGRGVRLLIDAGKFQLPNLALTNFGCQYARSSDHPPMRCEKLDTNERPFNNESTALRISD